MIEKISKNEQKKNTVMYEQKQITIIPRFSKKKQLFKYEEKSFNLTLVQIGKRLKK